MDGWSPNLSASAKVPIGDSLLSSAGEDQSLVSLEQKGEKSTSPAHVVQKEGAKDILKSMDADSETIAGRSPPTIFTANAS